MRFAPGENSRSLDKVRSSGNGSITTFLDPGPHTSSSPTFKAWLCDFRRCRLLPPFALNVIIMLLTLAAHNDMKNIMTFPDLPMV